MAATVEVNCQRCGDLFTARVADRRRGWGKFCSKSCKAIRQTYGKGAFKPDRSQERKPDLLALIERKDRLISCDQDC